MILFSAYLVLGAFAGILAGLLGLGGGILIVPVLVIALEVQGVDQALIIHMALATSLATIVLTSLSSIFTHHQRGAIRWEFFGTIVIGILLGSALGVETALSLEPELLMGIFGIFLLLVSAILAFNVVPSSGRGMPGKSAMMVAGVLIGWCSAMLGIGGGTLSVPFFSWCNLRMQQAVALAAPCGLAIAVMSTVVNLIESWGRPDLPAMSAGFIYLPALVAIVITSVPFARLGATFAHRLPAARLRQAFALVLFLIGIEFII